MTTNELKKHHEELNLPVGIRLEIMEAHAERLEAALESIARSSMSHFIDYHHAYSRSREKAIAALANAAISQPGQNAAKPDL
jgi:hypothetical protein